MDDKVVVTDMSLFEVVAASGIIGVSDSIGSVAVSFEAHSTSICVALGSLPDRRRRSQSPAAL